MDKIELNEISYNIIRSVMDTIIDNNLEIVSNIREIYETAPADKIRGLIAKHFIPTLDEKKKNAEIPTPVKLCDEMIDKMPPEFWTAIHTVFEPCCGKGNFVLAIFDRFFRGLAESIPDETDRCMAIVNECLYYADLTPLNVFVTTELLKCHVQSYCGIAEFDESWKFHSYTGDTLKMDVGEMWRVEGFDAVIGNPPYNSSGKTATGNTIWQHFTKKSLKEWINTNGYLVFVHPPGWRKPNTERGKFTDLFNLMTKENQMLYLEIHGIKDGQKTFGCGTRYDWYVIEKNDVYKETVVKDECGLITELNLNIFKWIPNSNILEIEKILAKEEDETCPIMYSCSSYETRKKWMSSIQNDIFIYPCIHTIPLTGTRYLYSKINDKGHFGVSKVIFGDNGLNDVIIDINGEYGMTENSMAIQITTEEEGQQLKNVLLNNKFKLIIKSCIIGNFRIDWRLFTTFRKDFWKEFV